MRKAQKEQATEFLKSLCQANKEIKRALEHSEQALAMGLLEQCQEGAIALGNVIEQSEGEDFAAVRLLEEYCERIYQLHEKLRQGLFIKVGKEYKVLQNFIMQAENSVRNDIKERREVVFLPYKASMWDSLESVWRAADADPNCDAYVIPIPYYNKNLDGSFREMHYEGNLYPKDVPVIWYKDYDFEERRPDVVFIHNPYDGVNLVTSVHPDFFSDKLKRYTERLVYIPYFLLPEIDPKNTEAIKRIEDFCTAPAVVNADTVILQSEAMRQIYIDVLSRHAGEHTRKIWEKKILGLGSPKVDKVLRTRKEDLEIPEDWLNIIRKADGTWKKIVFYNTGMAALMEHGEKTLSKMRSVFETFKNNQEEVALLWRPHPLIKATLSSMRPYLWTAYEEILEEYRSEGWGIYDDTADLDRAVILCDAYYGDGSSVVQLCLKVNKPVMIQNLRIL